MTMPSYEDFLDINSPAGGGGEEESVFDPTYGGTQPITDPATDPNTNPNDGTGDSPYKPGSVFKNQTPIDTGGISSILKKLFVNKDGTLNLQALGAMGGGLAGLLGANSAKTTPTGYQGKIPKYTAVRNMITAPSAGRRPGAGGTRYGGNVSFVPKGSVPAQDTTGGISDLAREKIGLGGSPTYKESGSPTNKMVGKDDAFYKSPEYKEFQKSQEGMMGTMDMYNSPYFGSVGSGSSGRAMDEAYEKYKGISSAGKPRMVIGDEGASSGGVRNSADPSRLMAMLNQSYAQGGLTNLAHGRYLQGDTDGMADKIPARIGKDQPAALSHGEFVVPADVVSHLGNGNSDAGAKKLYDMMDRIRQARTGTKKQGKEINPNKFMPGGLAQAYAQGGEVQHYDGGGVTGAGTAANAGVTGTESSLSNWAGDYVTDMLGQGKALSEMPYEAYGGPLTADASDLQKKAFGAANNLSVPTSVTTAANTAGDIANKAQGMTYTPGTFSNQYSAPTPYQAGSFTNQYTAPTPYQAADFKSSNFDQGQAQQYMNPYLRTSLDPQLAEARRQASISEQENKAAMTKAGAFGGGRSAILAAEGQRNLGTKLADITGKGYDTAYKNAMEQFNSDQSRNMLAQQETEKSRQFGSTQGMNAAELKAKYGQDAARDIEASRQFGSTQGMTAAELKAKYGQDAARDVESSRQFGATQGLNTLKTALDATKAQGDLGISGADLNLRNIKAQGDLGAVQRGIDAEGIAADKTAFEEARENPYKMVQFQQSLLKGLPLEAQTINTAQPSTFQQMLAGAGGIAGLFGNKTSLTQDDVTAALAKLGIKV